VNVKPLLLAAWATLHLLGSKCLIEFGFDSEVFFVERGFLVVACKPGGRLVEVTRGTLFGRVSSVGAANRVTCKAWASSRATTSR
jgi:hypothetical protein